MKDSLRVLLVEGMTADAESILAKLRLAGFDPVWKRVDTESDYLAMLTPAPDIILSDYALPQFSALRALQLLQARALDIPLVIVSSAISDEAAIECIKQGAADYLLKDRLTRLGSSVRRALKEKRLRDEQLAAMKTLQYQAQLLANVSDAIIATDPHFKITAWNRGAEQVFGWREDEVMGKSLLEITQPEFGALGLDQMKQAVTAHGGWSGEIVEQHKNGARLDIQVAIRSFIDENGQVIGAVSVNRDITERKRVEEALRASEEKFSSAFHISPDSININRLSDGLYLEINEGFTLLTGYTPEDVRGKTSLELSIWADVEDRNRLVKELKAHGLVNNLEARFRLKDGTMKIALMSARITQVNGEACILSVTRDITDRKQAADEIRRLKEFNERIVQSMQEGIIIENAEGTFTFANPAAANQFGYTRDELLGQPWTLVIPSDQHAIVRAADARRVLGKADSYELEIARKDGTRIPMLVSGNPIIEQGTYAGNMAVFTNIAEHKQRERELEAIASISAALRAASTYSEMPPILLKEMMSLFKADSAALMWADSQTDEFYYELALGGWTGLIGRRIPPGKGIVGQVVKTGQPYVTNDLPNDPLFYLRDMVGNSAAYACAPLIAQGETVGLVEFKRQTPIRDEDIRLLTSVADISANALNRATLHDKTEQRLEQLTALRTIDRAISASLDLKIILIVLLDQVVVQLNADAADILLFNPHLQTLAHIAGCGFRTAGTERTSIRIGVGYAGRALLERRIVSTTDLAHVDNFSRGASFKQEGFITYHAVPLFVKGNPKGVLEVFHRSLQNPDAEWIGFLEALAGQAAIALDSAQLFEELQQSNAQLALAYDATIEGWSRALDLRDHETEGHTLRVTEMTLRLAQTLRVSGQDLVHIRRGALLHDIGKMGVPDGILRKPGPLTVEEWQIMRCHPIYAHDLLSPIEYLRSAMDIPYGHHEKWDGTGYPRGLKGEQIPLAARIFAIVDVWDAIRSDRPYRPAWNKEKTRQHIQSESNRQFDPHIVQIFLNMLDQE